jgi:hypothetical protein
MKRVPSLRTARGGAWSLGPILLLLVVAAAMRAEAQTTAAPAAAKGAIETKSPAKNCCAVQVGAYEDPAEAEAAMESLAREFSNAIQMSQTIGGGSTRWRVRILATTRAEARAIAARLLSKRGTKAWIEPIACPNP